MQTGNGMRWPFTMPQDILGVRFALNVAIATIIVWYSLARIADTNPIWAIASMVAASDPQVNEASRIRFAQTGLSHSHGGQPIWDATAHTIQTKLATDAKASDSRARRTIAPQETRSFSTMI